MTEERMKEIIANPDCIIPEEIAALTQKERSMIVQLAVERVKDLEHERQALLDKVRKKFL